MTNTELTAIRDEWMTELRDRLVEHIYLDAHNWLGYTDVDWDEEDVESLAEMMEKSIGLTVYPVEPLM